MNTKALLEVQDLRVEFHGQKRFLKRPAPIRAVDGISLTVEAGETLGLVGESGCGKSTAARAMMRLIEPTGGSIHLAGQDFRNLSKSALRKARKDVQMIFQDPYSSLDPSKIVADSIGEPLVLHEGLKGVEKYQRVAELLEKVGLPPEYMNRYPHEFSGGQRQRLTIARAVAMKPKLIVCDEAVSALDVSSQRQVLELLAQLSRDEDITYIFISHDLSVVRSVSHRVAVMYLGQIVEQGPVEEVFGAPMHPYTYALLSAIPVPSPTQQRQRQRIVLAGDPPDPSNVPSGCRFQQRCPFAMDICRQRAPEMVEHRPGVKVACHLQSTGPVLAGASVATLQHVE